jgi:glutathione synthase/RimK-type ligase-like ATP-grasp enzyme
MDFLLDFGYCGFDVVTAKSDVFLLEVDHRSPADGRADLGPVKDC